MSWGSSCHGVFMSWGLFTSRSFHFAESSHRGVFTSWGSWGLHVLGVLYVVGSSRCGVFISWGLHLWGSSLCGVFTSWGPHVMGSSQHGGLGVLMSRGLHVLGALYVVGFSLHGVFTSWGPSLCGVFTPWAPPLPTRPRFWGRGRAGPPDGGRAPSSARPLTAARWRRGCGAGPGSRGGRWGRLGRPQKTSLGLLAGGGRRAPAVGCELCENLIKKANARALCWPPSHADTRPSFGPNGLKAWWQPPGGFGEHEGRYKAPKDPQNVQHNCLGCEPPLHQNRIPTRPGSVLRELVPHCSKRTLGV